MLLNRAFARLVRRERVSTDALLEAARRVEQGLVDADLGGGVIKQRVTRPGQGRSGGYRTIIIYRRGDRAIFFRGFAKNERDNIEPHELHAIRPLL